MIFPRRERKSKSASGAELAAEASLNDHGVKKILIESKQIAPARVNDSDQPERITPYL